ncbi:MAG: hypothetical protein Ct9H300mP1_14320 [Planctomycetaceae bacterium]|nr:MAG: hypothetical protein Ct9H300mP1_14320 [Planctomycetaceae bacterium]
MGSELLNGPRRTFSNGGPPPSTPGRVLDEIRSTAACTEAASGRFPGHRPGGLGIPHCTGLRRRRPLRLFQRPSSWTRAPVDFRSVQWKRRVGIEFSPQHNDGDWWWNTRMGPARLRPVPAVPAGRRQTVASLTLMGLDQFLPKWNSRAIGLTDIHVVEQHRVRGSAGCYHRDAQTSQAGDDQPVEAHAEESDEALRGCWPAVVSSGRRGTQYRTTAT